MDYFEKISQLTDEELVSLVLDDQNSFALITARYKNKLFNYIRRLTSIRDEDAEDLLQEIFLKVYLNLNSFNQSMKFSSWIYAIARHQVISHFRKVKARPEGHADILDEQLANRLVADFDLPKMIDRRNNGEIINKALFRLKTKYKDVIILKFFEDKSYQEISDIIRKPVGTVGSMLNRAKEELRKELRSLEQI